MTNDAIASTLENLLARVRLDSAFYFSVFAAAPWATRTPHMRNIGRLVMPKAQFILPFHIMLEGEAWCWRSADPSDKRSFRAGEILLLPRGCDHVIASGRSPDFVPETDAEIYREAEASGRPCTHVELGGEGPKAQFLCGYFGGPKKSFHPLFDALPDLMVLKPTAAKWDVLRRLILIATETQKDRAAGGRLVAARLAEAMFVDAVQQHLAALPPSSRKGWLSALLDPQIGAVLKAIHDAPMEAWTIDRLRRIAGMSRSVFMARFCALVGRSPIQYLQSWRLQIAANLLAQTDTSITRIAQECGYHAETSFHRAFKQKIGVTPGAWRDLHAEHDKSVAAENIGDRPHGARLARRTESLRVLRGVEPAAERGQS